MIKMRSTTLLLSLIAPTFFGGEPENSKASLKIPRNGDVEVTSDQKDSNRLCLASLKAHAGPRKLSDLSAFRAFNRYPPDPATVSSPDEVKLSSLKRIKLASECLTFMPFEFDIFEKDDLRTGNATDLYPIHAWTSGDSYIAIYMYREYTQGDYEGDSITLSAVLYDDSARIAGSIPRLSWWHDIEGSILVHDAKFTSRGISIVETVFDPYQRDDATGHFLKYEKSSKEMVIRKYVMDGGRYVEAW